MQFIMLLATVCEKPIDGMNKINNDRFITLSCSDGVLNKTVLHCSVSHQCTGNPVAFTVCQLP